MSGWGGTALLYVAPSPFPCSLCRGGKQKGGEARHGYPRSIRETGSERKQLSQGGRDKSKSWKHKSLCSKCLSKAPIRPARPARHLFELPALPLVCNENLSLRKVLGGTFMGELPRAEGSAEGLGNLILLHQRSAAILSSSQSHQSLGQVSCHVSCFYSLFCCCCCFPFVTTG